jgi:DNA-binding response OmpR family regulator
MKVLVVDDNQDQANGIKGVLEEEGIEARPLDFPQESRRRQGLKSK